MGSNIKLIFFIIIGISLVVFVVGSGVFGKLSGDANSTSTKKSWGIGDIFKPKPFIPPTRNSGSNDKGEDPEEPSQTTSSPIVPKDIPTGFTLSQLSPHFNKFKIGSVSPGSATSNGRVSISNTLKEGERIDVTGWVLKAKKASLYIPQAVAVYGPLGLDKPSSITLGKGEVLNIYTNKSPIGLNLRMNKCIGYLDTTINKFSPALPKNCPDPIDDVSGLYNLSSRCEDYIDSLSRCVVPKIDSQVWLQGQGEYACREFLNKVNYKGCYDAHLADADFLGKEWRVWTGTRFLDPRHDRILLFDKQGLLVREYIY
jgi:hypothetical protein